jgi:SAM-dependent methyltransferase
MSPDWNQLFEDPSKILREPDPLVDAFIREIPPQGIVFDLGCGAGRHLVHLAGTGLKVIGGDIAPDGLERARKWLKDRRLSAGLVLSEMTALPFPEGIFSGVVSINVLNHAVVENTARAVAEVRRILKPGGAFFFLIIGREDARYGEGDEIEPHTFIHRKGIEAGVPHHFYTADEVLRLVSKFSRYELTERRRLYDDALPVFGNDPRLKNKRDAFLQHWEVRTWK